MTVYEGIMQGLNEVATYEQLYKELVRLSKELLPYYDIDKVKWYSVAVWDKEDLGKNLFDITAYEIYFWDGYDANMIPEKAMLIVEKIQIKLREIQFFFHRENHKEYYE